MNNEDKILEMLGAMQQDIQNMKSDMQGMKSDMQGMKSDMQNMKSDMRGVKTEITKLHSKIDALAASQEQTRVTVNALVEWTDKVSAVYELPLPKL